MNTHNESLIDGYHLKHPEIVLGFGRAHQSIASALVMNATAAVQTLRRIRPFRFHNRGFPNWTVSAESLF
jgi:hypothetical protein